MELTAANIVLVALAALAAGFVNAVAGGGTLISFPMLTFVGIPPVAANITNTVALSPGYLGGSHAQRADLAGQHARLVRILPVAAAGGLTGGILLLVTSEALFRQLVPYLILLACALLAAQNHIRSWVLERRARRSEPGSGLADPTHDVTPTSMGAIYLASIYGGYFGAGLGIILLAVLGALLDDTLTRLNALKQTVSLTVNTTAALFFLFSGRVVWGAALIMAVGSLAGGQVGGRVASRLNPTVLRSVVIGIGLVVAIIYFVR